MNVKALLRLAVVAASTGKLAQGDGLSFPYPDQGAAAGVAGAAGAVGVSIWEFLQNAPGLMNPPEDQDDPNAGPATEPDFQLNAVTSQPAAYLNCDPGSDFSALLDSSVR